MSVTGYRYITVRVPNEVEEKARASAGLSSIPLAALIRICLAIVGGYSAGEAFDRYYLDPTSKRYRDIQEAQRTATEADSDHQPGN
jgi:hypothetical protein